MNTLALFFMPSADVQQERYGTKSFLLIKFILISILFAIGYYFFSFITGYLVARYVMIMASIIMVAQLFSLKYHILSVKWNSHLFVLVSWIIVASLSFASGGIRSFVLPWISLIPIICLLLVGSVMAWVWGFIGLVTVVLFTLMDVDHYLPEHLMMRQNDLWTASLLIGLQFLILTITYIFDRQLSEARTVIEIQNNELQARNINLEEEINHRTKELIEYNHQLEQFAFISSHNLRAPVASILGLGNLLKISQSREDELAVSQKLIHATVKLDSVVKDLNMILEVRKNINMTFVDISLQQEVNLILFNLNHDIEVTQAKIHISIGREDTLRTVRPYFSSIVFNLLSNALKYRKPNKAPEIYLSIFQQGTFICISVSDRGLGMDLSTIREKLFTLYSRFHDHIDGKGVGLYLVKTQAEALGGYVTAESQVGAGTTIQVFIKEIEKGTDN